MLQQGGSISQIMVLWELVYDPPLNLAGISQWLHVLIERQQYVIELRAIAAAIALLVLAWLPLELLRLALREIVAGQECVNQMPLVRHEKEVVLQYCGYSLFRFGVVE